MLTFIRLTPQISPVSLLSDSPLCEEPTQKAWSLPLGFCKFNWGEGVTELPSDKE